MAGPLATFGKYELVARLARGGMAETYRAQLKGAAGVTKQVVIKKVLPHFAEDEVFIEAFINEAKISASLSHGNIAQVFDFGRVEGDYFLAMELVDGRSLNQVLARAQEKGFAKLPVPIACFLAMEVLKGLHYAHTRVGEDGKPLSLVHRDVSPENVLISFEGDVKVVDFGVAKAVMRGRRETEPGLVKGKFLFFSPEQAVADPVDARSDVYAVGILLYRMLCGGLPFEGQMHTVMRAIVAGRFIPAAVVHPGLPSALVAVLDRAMKTKREERFGTALQMQEALASFLYRQEPTFSSETVKEWMTWLFRPELAADGRPTGLSGRFESQLTRWGATGNAGPVPEVTTAPGVQAVTRPAAPAEGKEGASIAPWLAILALGLVAALGVAVVLGIESEAPPPPTGPFRVPNAAGDTRRAEPAPVVAPVAAPVVAPAPVPVPTPTETPEPPIEPAPVAGAPQKAAAPNDENERIFARQKMNLVPCLARLPSQAPITVGVKVELGVVTGVTLDPPSRAISSVLQCLLTEARTWEFAVLPGRERTLTARLDPKDAGTVAAAKAAAAKASNPNRADGSLLEEAKRLMLERQYPAARDVLVKCVRVEPRNADCHKLLGTAWAKLGDPDRGAREYKEFLRLAPSDHPDIEKVKSIINQYEAAR